MCRGTQRQESGDSWVVAFTSEPSSIYSCLHVQHTQQTGDLPPLSTSGITTASLPFRSQLSLLKRERKARALPLHSYTITSAIPGERGALASKPCSKFREKLNLVIAQSKGCTHSSELDRQTDRQESDPGRHIPSLLHTQGLEQLLDQSHGQCRWGMVPIPLGKAKEASFEIPGVPKS